jgi:flagellar L-ring protein FlgH
MKQLCLAAAVFAALAFTEARAEDLFNDAFAALAADQRASQVGDVVTIVVYQSAEARNAAQNASSTRRSFEAEVSGGDLAESGALSLNGGYSGQGEVRRSESFLTQISARVEAVAANGDLVVAGEQSMRMNGETTIVRVRGLVRPSDIEHGNRVLSSRLADAEISYEGRGFVSRNAEPNLIHRLLSLLGLGG